MSIGPVTCAWLCWLQDRRPVLQSRQTRNCNNLHILLAYSRYTDSRAFWGHLRQTYCQHSLHRRTLLLVGSRAVPTSFGTVFPHLYTPLTVSLVLGLSSRLRKTFVAGPLSAPQVFRALLIRYLLKSTAMTADCLSTRLLLFRQCNVDYMLITLGRTWRRRGRLREFKCSAIYFRLMSSSGHGPSTHRAALLVLISGPWRHVSTKTTTTTARWRHVRALRSTSSSSRITAS